MNSSRIESYSSSSKTFFFGKPCALTALGAAPSDGGDRRYFLAMLLGPTAIEAASGATNEQLAAAADEAPPLGRHILAQTRLRKRSRRGRGDDSMQGAPAIDGWHPVYVPTDSYSCARDAEYCGSFCAHPKLKTSRFALGPKNVHQPWPLALKCNRA